MVMSPVCTLHISLAHHVMAVSALMQEQSIALPKPDFKPRNVDFLPVQCYIMGIRIDTEKNGMDYYNIEAFDATGLVKTVFT